MSIFGIATHLPENLEVQAVALKMIGLTIMCAALIYLGAIDGRVAAMVMGGALGGAFVWLIGFRQECGWKATAVQAAVAGVCVLCAEQLWALL